MPDRVGVVGPGDVAGDVDGLEARGGVGVEVPVALLGRRVAPADREVRDARGDRALDEAAAGRQVGDVVLVDLRRDDHERSLVDPRRRLLVLDQLEHVGAVYDLTRRDARGSCRRRRACVSTWDGMPPLCRRSCPTLRAPATRLCPRVWTALASASGLVRRLLVGATRLRQQRHREVAANPALGVEIHLVDHPVGRVGLRRGTPAQGAGTAGGLATRRRRSDDHPSLGRRRCDRARRAASRLRRRSRWLRLRPAPPRRAVRPGPAPPPPGPG